MNGYKIRFSFVDENSESDGKGDTLKECVEDLRSTLLADGFLTKNDIVYMNDDVVGTLYVCKEVDSFGVHLAIPEKVGEIPVIEFAGLIRHEASLVPPTESMIYTKTSFYEDVMLRIPETFQDVAVANVRIRLGNEDCKKWADAFGI